MAYQFVCNCVGSGDGQAITAMVDRAKDITRATFVRAVDRESLTEIERGLSYDTGTERGGLRMSNDWHVSYHRSTFRGRPCVYFRHSAIEWIFQ